MTANRALLIFCEGPHDVAFVCLVLRELFSFSDEKLALSRLPKPLGSLFGQTIKSHGATDFRLDLAKKFFMPDKVLMGEDGLCVLLFNYGGSERKNNLLPFLEKLFLLLGAGATFGGGDTEFRYLITADADHFGTGQVLAQITNDLGIIDAQAWLTNDWIGQEGTFGAVQKENPAIGAYIWRSEVSDQGTLEDLLCDCLNEVELFISAQKAVTETFSWDTAHENQQRAIAEQARQHKASITSMGQRECPGSSMSVILEKSGVLKADKLETTQSTSRFVRFLQLFLAVGVSSK